MVDAVAGGVGDEQRAVLRDGQSGRPREVLCLRLAGDQVRPAVARDLVEVAAVHLADVQHAVVAERDAERAVHRRVFVAFDRARDGADVAARRDAADRVVAQVGDIDAIQRVHRDAGGRVEAREAGRLLKAEGFEFDLAFTSVLKRAIRTLWIVLDEMDLMWLPVERSWRLNERHYGALQGLDKAQTVEKHGADQVKIWRRSYDIPPPPLPLDDQRHPRFERRYSSLKAEELPATESLKTTLERVLPYWTPGSHPN